MRELLVAATEFCALIIEAMALVVILIGTIEAFFAAIRSAVSSIDPHQRREIWLNYARWLVAGLTFQLASDIIETAVAPSWNDIGRLAAVALIRTFLNVFLERDLTDIRDRQHEQADEIAVTK